MKALTLTQPWATAILLRNKKIETRSWKTNYRGRIAIHAAKGFPKYARNFTKTEQAIGRLPQSIEKLSFGAIICLATIVDIRPTEDLYFNITKLERTYGDYGHGRWGWILTNIRPLVEPIPCKGHLGLWEVPFDVIKVMNI
jgi:hypothetical protein